MEILKAPFPWFGGKSRVAELVWSRFGPTKNYVEPFFGSGAVLLGRPYKPGIETVNDKDAYLANFWRALQAAPAKVARWADWPVNEADLHARHKWLLSQSRFRELMGTEPEYYDVKVAGWWVWGVSCWIGSGWCRERFYNSRQPEGLGRPHLSTKGHGLNRGTISPKAGQSIPVLGNYGMGVNRSSLPDINEYMQALAARLRRVRVCCGDWSRIVGKSPTYNLGLTGVFLDPPYSDRAARDTDLYGVDDLTVAHQARAWAVDNAKNPLLRVAFCGYEGEHFFPPDWDCVAWKTHGGYANRNPGNLNTSRERIWFSPHCLQPTKQLALFV